MRLELSRYINVAEAISKLLSPFAEVVVHDLSTNKIEAIFNSISKRKVGDSSYLDHINLETYDELSNVIGPYEKLNYDGRKLKCIISIIRDNTGVAVGTLCINLDISVFDKYQGILQLFLTNNDKEMSQKSQSLFKDTLYEQINNFVQKYCLNHSLSIDNLTRLQKKNLILESHI
jgi:predicted transcriptional regulator YheO